jgi:hypothetical protein
MPRIDWTSLPRAVRKHLEDRARTRELTAQDLMRLMDWVLSNPEVPDEPWCKDFGAFKLVGHGAVPNTFLERDQPCFGKRI